MIEKEAKSVPEYFADLMNKARGATGHVAPGHAGPAPATPTHAQRLVQYVEPAVQAAEGLRADAKMLRDAADRAGGKGSGSRIQGAIHGIMGDAAHALHEHAPGALDAVSQGIDRLRGHFAPAPAPWYHDPMLAGGAGLAGAGALGLGAYGLSQMGRHRQGPQQQQQQQDDQRGPSPVQKISAALDLLADELDAMPVVAAGEAKVAEEADIFGSFQDFYRERVGEEMPAALVEKLAKDADGETVDALKKLMKTASHERPTPLGEPSEGGSYRAPPESRHDVTKLAWEQFEETLLNYEGA